MLRRHLRSPQLVLALLSPALSACNTMEGAGQDMEAAGDAISDGAEETKPS